MVAARNRNAKLASRIIQDHNLRVRISSRPSGCEIGVPRSYPHAIKHGRDALVSGRVAGGFMRYAGSTATLSRKRALPLLNRGGQAGIELDGQFEDASFRKTCTVHM